METLNKNLLKSALKSALCRIIFMGEVLDKYTRTKSPGIYNKHTQT